jgi:GT2 family glycosyltransferase
VEDPKPKTDNGRSAGDRNATRGGTERPGISVVIVNWNTRDMVLRLLRSLSSPVAGSPRAGDPPLELIVVDNGSTDGSVEAIAAELPEVHVVDQRDNRGFAGGVNPGVKLATQPLVLLLNSDAQTTRASIAEAAEYMARHPEVGVLGPQILNPDRSPQTSAWREPALRWVALSALGLSKLRWMNFERYQERVFAAPEAVECVCGCAMMIRRDLFDRLHGLDEDFFMYFEETDFCVRTRRLGYQVHHAPIGSFTHEDGGTSRRVRLRTYLDFRRSQILFHLKHGGRGEALAARGLLALANAVRIPPLLALSVLGGSRRERATARLELNVRGLMWLLDPRSALVPDVDRSE